MNKRFFNTLLTLTITASASLLASHSQAASVSYNCEVIRASVSSPLEKLRSPLALTISTDPAGKYSLSLVHGNKRLEADNYTSNLYVSTQQNFYTGDKPKFVNVSLDAQLNGLADSGRLHLTPVWPNFKSDDYLFCSK
jgi:hypothetical protein